MGPMEPQEKIPRDEMGNLVRVFMPMMSFSQALPLPGFIEIAKHSPGIFVAGVTLYEHTLKAHVQDGCREAELWK